MDAASPAAVQVCPPSADRRVRMAVPPVGRDSFHASQTPSPLARTSACPDVSEEPIVAACLARPCYETALPLYRRKLAEAAAHLRAARALQRQFHLDQKGAP